MGANGARSLLLDDCVKERNSTGCRATAEQRGQRAGRIAEVRQGSGDQTDNRREEQDDRRAKAEKRS